MKNGGWIFISHSHQDIGLVRKIRNRLESLGLEPLMFYLKCLSDENEIEELIKREIDERDWFIYADSKNARESKWVRTEREYIEGLEGKQVFTIDLNEDIDKQLLQIEHIARQMKVYISCSVNDVGLREKIKNKLLERDMLVIDGEDVVGEESIEWNENAEKVINDVARNGFVILLLTKTSIKSDFVRYEIKATLGCGGKIVPVYVGDTRITEELLPYIGDIQGVSISENPTRAELGRIVEYIIHRVEYYHSDFRDSCSYKSARRIHLPKISRLDGLTFFGCDNLECVYIPNTVIYIEPDTFSEHPDVLIKCSPGSYAEQFCIRNGIRYEITGE